MRRIRADPPADARAMEARVLENGEGRILVPMSVLEAEELAYACSNPKVRARLITAIGLLDYDRSSRIQGDTDDL